MDFVTGAVTLSAQTANIPPPNGPVFWHPTADALLASTDGRHHLYGMDGRSVRVLPAGARPEHWFDRGRALLVTYPRRETRVLAFEVWRV